jgi:hypothetical protein
MTCGECGHAIADTGIADGIALMTLHRSLPPQVLAYGQTGSGKTYTMGTTCGKKELASSHPSNPVIPWALQELFKYLGEATKTHEVTLLVRGGGGGHAGCSVNVSGLPLWACCCQACYTSWRQHISMCKHRQALRSCCCQAGRVCTAASGRPSWYTQHCCVQCHERLMV